MIESQWNGKAKWINQSNRSIPFDPFADIIDISSKYECVQSLVVNPYLVSLSDRQRLEIFEIVWCKCNKKRKRLNEKTLTCKMYNEKTRTNDMKSAEKQCEAFRGKVYDFFLTSHHKPFSVGLQLDNKLAVDLLYATVPSRINHLYMPVYNFKCFL